MASAAENVKLGVCNVIFDGNDLGYTKGGVEVEVTTSTHEVTVDQHGETPIGELITGRTVSVSVPLAETTLDNLIAIMPGSELITDGVRSEGSITLNDIPEDGDKITINEIDFTWKTTPTAQYDLPIPSTVNAGAAALAAMINTAPVGFFAVVDETDADTVNVTARQRGTAGNISIDVDFGTTADITVVDPTGGVDVTAAQVKVSSGININLLSVAKQLVLRPKGTTGEDDFTIYRAACPGALTFAYQHDAERVYQANFKGYVKDNGDLFAIGDVSATG